MLYSKVIIYKKEAGIKNADLLKKLETKNRDYLEKKGKILRIKWLLPALWREVKRNKGKKASIVILSF